jgi:hypothetical protein
MNVSVSAIPPNATAENLQELVNLVGQAITVTFPRDASVFGTGNGIPTSNVGLWFSNGSWYYFNDATGKYEPVVLPQSSLRYILSQSAPSRLTYDVWFVLSGSGEPIDVRIWFNNAWTSIYYSRATLDSWFNGLSGGGKAQVDWANVVNKQPYGWIPSGVTFNRTPFETVGTLFYDTQINRVLIFTSNGWSTADGAIGDVKFTASLDESTALLRNPGWAIFEQLKGRFPIGAGQGIGLTNRPVGTTGGDEESTITINELPNHTHPNGIVSNAPNNGGSIDGFGSNDAFGNDNYITSNTGGVDNADGDPFSNMPPYLALIALIKQF